MLAPGTFKVFTSTFQDNSPTVSSPVQGLVSVNWLRPEIERKLIGAGGTVIQYRGYRSDLIVTANS
jgi:hypothetical protein